jgi:hypothetical protein
MSTTLDFNDANLSERPINELLNELIEHSEPPRENVRQYLGASAIGSECQRRIQYDWMCDPVHPVRTLSIFARGHFHETLAREHLTRAGFKFASPERLQFEAADGLFRGHADGILIAGPQLPALRYPCIWEHKCLNAKGWRAIERDGLTGLYAVYLAQIVTYQAYLDLTNAALCTITNADTCERLHLLVPFDAALAQMMTDRAVTIIEATRHGELLGRISDDPNDWRCKMCSHRERCWR